MRDVNFVSNLLLMGTCFAAAFRRGLFELACDAVSSTRLTSSVGCFVRQGVTSAVSCVCTACEDGSVPYTLKYPEINPSVVPPDNSILINLPDVDGVPPSEYQVMEIIIDISDGDFPVTVLIYDAEGTEVYSVSIMVREAKRAVSLRTAVVD